MVRFILTVVVRKWTEYALPFDCEPERQANKKKLSPLTNHKNTKNGAITGGFDRVNLFQQTEQDLINCSVITDNNLESFDYNTMKNGSIFEQLDLQAQTFIGEKEKDTFQPSERKQYFLQSW